MATTEQQQQRNRWISEARAGPELAAFVATAGPLLARAPRGDGHPVLVLPGLGAGDPSTRPLRWFLRRLGYHTHGWKLGTNSGPSHSIRAGLAQLVDGLAARHGQPISIVGWSLGGVYACTIAQRVPDDVRQVITLGSPLNYAPDPPARVPMTSVYSRSDAVVPWRASLVRPGPGRQNVEVRGSHIGLGHNPPVLLVISDRLAQPAGSWTPYEPPAWARRWLPPGG